MTIKKTFVSFQYSDADYSGSGGAVEGVSLQHRGFIAFQIVLHRRKISGILKNSEKIEENPSQPHHVETMWGAGYRFKA
ncbi:hypothetical protein [uncultured Ruminococcus sp.]|uniref:hypothetical protein n=1 Tax=uncultured Ruminococcus sp. TaxID=165186 RepID=UPI0025E6891C|nr:hypothetical protein [uncultured Ruminococcus sp.]